jgi:AcrR family transcriptional regulator
VRRLDSIKVRKKPSQARSADTVEAILSSTAHILVKEGYARATTNRIAEAAGVSIGSVYQYFPSKDALIAELIERHLAQRRALMLEHLGRPRRSLAQSVRVFVEALVEAQAVNLPLQRAIIEQVPRVVGVDRLLAYERELVGLVQVYLSATPEPLAPNDLGTAAFVLVHAVHGASLAAVADPPARLSRTKLVDELTRLATRYLLAS